MKPEPNRIAKAREDMKIQILKELSASGMLPQNRISLEVLYLLPTEFIEQYVVLFFEALREDAKGTDLEARAGEMTQRTKIKLSDRKGVRTREDGTIEGPIARGAQGEGTKRYRNAWVIRNERALRLKGEIDRKLRQLSVDIISGLKPEANLSLGLKCRGAGCGRFMKSEWHYCPTCGTARSKRNSGSKGN